MELTLPTMTASPLNARCAASSLSLTDREPWSPHGTVLSYNMQTATRAKFHWCLPESDLTEFLFITTAEPVKYSNDSWDNKRLKKRDSLSQHRLFGSAREPYLRQISTYVGCRSTGDHQNTR